MHRSNRREQSVNNQFWWSRKKSEKKVFVIPAQVPLLAGYFQIVRILWIPVFTGMTTFYEIIIFKMVRVRMDNLPKIQSKINEIISFLEASSLLLHHGGDVADHLAMDIEEDLGREEVIGVHVIKGRDQLFCGGIDIAGGTIGLLHLGPLPFSHLDRQWDELPGLFSDHISVVIGAVVFHFEVF